jgi:hypothetical protein
VGRFRMSKVNFKKIKGELKNSVQHRVSPLGYLTKLFSGFSRNTKLAKMLPCFAKLSRVSRISQDQIFAIFVFRESYQFRETRKIRLIKHNETKPRVLKNQEK